jgi:hypothetical protein
MLSQSPAVEPAPFGECVRLAFRATAFRLKARRVIDGFDRSHASTGHEAQRGT